MMLARARVRLVCSRLQRIGDDVTPRVSVGRAEMHVSHKVAVEWTEEQQSDRGQRWTDKHGQLEAQERYRGAADQ